MNIIIFNLNVSVLVPLGHRADAALRGGLAASCAQAPEVGGGAGVGGTGLEQTVPSVGQHQSCPGRLAHLPGGVALHHTHT